MKNILITLAVPSPKVNRSHVRNPPCRGVEGAMPSRLRRGPMPDTGDHRPVRTFKSSSFVADSSRLEFPRPALGPNRPVKHAMWCRAFDVRLHPSSLRRCRVGAPHSTGFAPRPRRGLHRIVFHQRVAMLFYQRAAKRIGDAARGSRVGDRRRNAPCETANRPTRDVWFRGSPPARRKENS